MSFRGCVKKFLENQVSPIHCTFLQPGTHFFWVPGSQTIGISIGIPVRIAVVAVGVAIVAIRVAAIRVAIG